MRGSGRYTTFVVAVVLGVALGIVSMPLSAQTVVFSDNFDPVPPAAGGVVRSADWPYTDVGGYPQSLPGKVLNYRVHQMQGSDAGHQKNHTGLPSEGGSAFEVNANPYPYAAYHQFDPQTGDLRVGAWIWDDVESRKPQSWPNPAQINGGLMLTALPNDDPIIFNNGITEIYTYDDFAFIGIQALIPSSKPDPNAPGFNPYSPQSVAVQYCYQWRTKTDGWHLTLDPNTGNPVPRRVDFRIPEQIPQTWRHVEIVVHPYSGRVGDIEFFIDGVLVGQGRRDPGLNCRGVELRRIQIGSRFPDESDAQAFRPPYSYEHLWFDDVLLTVEPADLPCANPALRFDADNDGDVDHVDFSLFQICYTDANDPGGKYNCDLCRCMNADVDQDIDGDDRTAFEQCASGPGVSADVACDDGLSFP